MRKMKSVIEKLNNQGWYLSEECLQELDPNSFKNGDGQNVNIDHLINLAANHDFRDIAKNGGALPTEGTKGNEFLPGKIILQIAKISNLSAPKANQESKTAPRLLQIEFTDGKTSMQSLELESVPNITLDTPPGTKVYFKSEKIPFFHGFMLLKPKDIQVIGGKVPHLIEKWELNRKLNKYSKDIRFLRSSGGPPRWLPFGQNIENIMNGVKETKFEVKQENGNGEPKNNDFDTQRSEAIAEASKSGNKKTFGGANNILPDFNVKKIMDKGFSEEEARAALRHTRNNLERAMFNLKRRGGQPERRSSSNGPAKSADKRGRKTEESVPSGKPTNVSLFDYLHEKFPEDSSQLPVNSTLANLPKTPTTTFKATEGDKFMKRENPFRKFDNYNSRENYHRGDNHRAKDDHYGSYNNRNDYKGSKDDYRNKDDKFKSKDENYRGNDEKFKDTKDDKQKEDYYNRNRDYRQPYQSNSYNKYNNPRYNSSQQQQGSNSGRPPTNYNKPDQIRNYNNNRSNFKPQDSNDNRYNQRREVYHPKSNNNFKKQENKTSVSDVADGISKMSVGHLTSSSPPQQQIQLHHNQPQAPYKREDKRDDKNKGRNYPFDPCKIVGFQNKETNDFALSLLKAEGMQPPTEEQLQHEAVIAVSASNSMPQLSLQVQSQPQSTFMAMPIYNAPTIHGHPMGAIATTPYQWKIGDHCLAKYWDDEKLYEAQITDVTQNTCVVFFTNYGNYEEVLKTDCYPILTENIAVGPGGHPMAIQMPLALPIPIQMSGIATQPPPPPPAHANPNYVSRNRNRGERQMYIPPPKRDR